MSPDPLLPVAGQRERLPGGVNPAADLRFFIGKHARRPRTDLEWFRHGEAAVLLEACQALKPRWAAFLLVCFTGGLRWGEATALHVGDIDWSRSRLHVQRTWSEDGGRIERTKDGEDRWVKLPASALEALRTQVEAMALEAQLNRWTHEQRRLVFPNGSGRSLATELSRSTSGDPCSRPRSSRTGSPTRCGTATPPGSWRGAPTSGGCNGNSGTRRSRRPATPTGIWSRTGTRNG